MSAKTNYVIAAFLLVLTIPLYMRIYARATVPTIDDSQKPSIQTANHLIPERHRASGWTDVHGLAVRGFAPGARLPVGYECSSPDGYVVAVKRYQGQKEIAPLMDNGQMLRCFHGVYGGNVR